MKNSNPNSNSTMPTTHSSTTVTELPAEERHLAEKAWDDKIMQNMKRMSQDETYRLEIAQYLS